MKTHDYGFVDTDSLIDRMDRAYNEMEAADAEAKADGSIVGRYLKEQAADGHAYYQIVGENDDGTLMIEHMDIYDGWSVPMYESMINCFPRQYADQNIGWRDDMDAMFERKK